MELYSIDWRDFFLSKINICSYNLPLSLWAINPCFSCITHILIASFIYLLVGGRFNKQFILKRLVLGSCKMNRSPLLSTKVLRIYIEALMGLNHMNCPDGFSSTLLSQDCVLENGSHHGNRGTNIHSKHRQGGKRSLMALVPLAVHPGVTSSWWPPLTVPHVIQDSAQVQLSRESSLTTHSNYQPLPLYFLISSQCL